MASLIKRLAHRNANVQLYTLEVCLLVREDVDLDADDDLARQCAVPELRAQDASGIVVEIVHGCAVALGQ